MIKTWTISDQDKKNFPVDESDLERRLKRVEDLIAQPELKGKDNNIRFTNEAFTLLNDCGLINADIVDKLSDKRWCDATISLRYVMNPLGGVLRLKGQPVWDATNLRYYCGFEDLEVPKDIETAKSRPAKGKTTIKVICDGETYYVSNDWYSEDKARPTKRAFYEFLAVATKKVCGDYWAKHQLAASIREIPAEALEKIVEEQPAPAQAKPVEEKVVAEKTVEEKYIDEDTFEEEYFEFKPVEVKPLKPLTPKDYEKMTEVDIAYRILTEAGKDNPIFFKDLILEVLDKKNKSVQNEAVAISEVYTMINMDSRFQHRGEGKWGLVEWNPPEAKRGRGTKKSGASSSSMDGLDGVEMLDK